MADVSYAPDDCRTTVVTALYDIHRDKWCNYTRGWDDYLKYASIALSLDVNMVIYVEEKDEQFMKDVRTHQSHKTIVKVLPFTELRNYRHLSKIKEIQDTPKYKAAQKDPSCPEVKEPLYNVVVTSKLDLVKQVVDENPFNSELFVWMDAGYGHGIRRWPEGKPWIPTKLLESLSENKVSVITLRNLRTMIDDNWGFYCQHVDIINGMMAGGSADAIRMYHKLFYDLFDTILDENIVDDDQYYAALIARRHPELIKPHLSGWYTGIKLFAS